LISCDNNTSKECQSLWLFQRTTCCFLIQLHVLENKCMTASKWKCCLHIFYRIELYLHSG
jgi:hypothetical protein